MAASWLPGHGRRQAALLATAVALLLAGCSSLPDPQERRDSANALAAAQGLQPRPLDTAPFALMAWTRPPVPGTVRLVVYIEGDGLAWLSGSQPSDDPTPLRPMALALAGRHPAGTDALAVLARPCQFTGTAGIAPCAVSAWTSHRFSPAAVASTQQALDQLKRLHGARELLLVGYSGGGAIAALAAASRTDVAGLVTVAGNLDHAAWTRRHRVLPLTGSLNPADQADRLAGLPQVHLVGARDTVITPADVQSYLDRFPASARPALRVIDGADHGCCWAERWPALWAQVPGWMAARPR